MDAVEDVVAHLVRTTPLSPSVAHRVVEEVLDFFDEPLEAFVRRRHAELQAAGHANRDIFGRLAAEVAARPVRAPSLSERQVRRLVYG